MPRMQPPPGWIKGSDVTKRLGISDSLLSRYVKAGRIRRRVPHGRTYGFYNEDDVRILEEVGIAFPDMREHQTYPSFLTIANRSDIPTLAKIDHDAIHPGDDVHLESSFLQWHQRNPETLFTLRSTTGAIVGFLCILPTGRSVLDLIRAGASGMDMFADIAPFTPGRSIHLYIGALAVDPSVPFTAKRAYGAALLSGLFRFLMSLAERGVTVETITATSHTPDGIKLMRKLGLPWLVSSAPGTELFSVRVAESGMPFLRKYSARIAETAPLSASLGTRRTDTQEKQIDASVPHPGAKNRHRSSEATHQLALLPDDVDAEGTISLDDLAAQLGILKRTLLGHITNEENGLKHIAVPNGTRTGEKKRSFTPEQAEAVRIWHAANRKKK